MLCILLERDKEPITVSGKPSVFVEEVTFQKILKDNDFANCIFEELRKSNGQDSQLIGWLGKKGDDNIFRSSKVTDEKINNLGVEEEVLGIYDHL